MSCLLVQATVLNRVNRSSGLVTEFTDALKYFVTLRTEEMSFIDLQSIIYREERHFLCLFVCLFPTLSGSFHHNCVNDTRKCPR